MKKMCVLTNIGQDVIFVPEKGSFVTCVHVIEFNLGQWQGPELCSGRSSPVRSRGHVIRWD